MCSLVECRTASDYKILHLYIAFLMNKLASWLPTFANHSRIGTFVRRNMMAFLKNPKAFVGGVINMNFRGIESWQVRLLHKSSQQPSKTHYVLNIDEYSVSDDIWSWLYLKVEPYHSMQDSSEQYLLHEWWIDMQPLFGRRCVSPCIKTGLVIWWFNFA